MMGGWPGALVAFSHLRLDSEQWEKRRRATSRGMCLHAPRLHVLVQRQEENHVPPAGDCWQTTGADYKSACLCSREAVSSKVRLVSPSKYSEQENEAGSTRAAGFMVIQGDAGGWALLQAKWREREGRFTSH